MIKHAEWIDGKLWHTEDICIRCEKTAPHWPGSLVKAIYEASGVTRYHRGYEDTQ